MRQPELRIYLDEGEACVDGFAGGGGTSTGIEWAIGRSPDIAINHNREALAMHKANHPDAEHTLTDIREVSPSDALRGRRCAFAWFSPDCTYFSKAKGGQPFRDPEHARRIRGLIGVALKWAALPRPQRPRVIFIENVEEIEGWCPLGPDGKPDPTKYGASFQRWLGRLRALGFAVEWRRLRGKDFGAPTTRQRLYIIARSDGQPIVWPVSTHGPALRPYRTAAECMDFDLPVPSIFLTPTEAKAWGQAHGLPSPKRPLAEATLRRIARGIHRFVLETGDPFIVNVRHAGGDRVYPLTEPLRTIPASDREVALVAPTLIKYHGGQARAHDLRDPIRTLDTSNRFGLVAAFLAKHNGGHEATGQRLERPVDTITTCDQKALVTSHLLKLRGGLTDHVVTGQDLRVPAPTLTAGGTHLAEVRAFLVKYYGNEKDGRSLLKPIDTIVTKDRFALVTVMIAGEPYVVVDIGMRMLTPRELFTAQGFPDDYEIQTGVDVETGAAVRFTKKAQTRLVGNSVVPHVAAAIISANLGVQGWRSERIA
ncbi:MAG: DNA cytosine methyltransferase [Acidobacteriota bacterium]|nr:DNA cytosine methyltransferase [Acidobacteriota bacterium]